MGGEHNPEFTSQTPISKIKKCPHGNYMAGSCSICNSEAIKKELTHDELRAAKKENSIRK
jgi:hypothetical protein